MNKGADKGDMKLANRRPLGRGLSALLGDVKQVFESDSNASIGLSIPPVKLIPIDKIRPGSQQPRKEFDPKSLNELADSIRQHGILQPIIVKPLADGNFEIIAGERRWRACQLAQKLEIPAIVRSIDEITQLELALVENLQRQDLNPVEEALGYRALIDQFGLTHEQVALKVGKDRATITNSLRLLQLPSEVLQWLSQNQLTVGHAKALLSIKERDQQIQLAKRVMEQGWSVRQLEKFVKSFNQTNKTEEPVKNQVLTESKTDVMSLQLKSLEEQVQIRWGIKARLDWDGRRGSVRLEFSQWSQFEKFLDHILG